MKLNRNDIFCRCLEHGVWHRRSDDGAYMGWGHSVLLPQPTFFSPGHQKRLSAQLRPDAPYVWNAPVLSDDYGEISILSGVASD